MKKRLLFVSMLVLSMFFNIGVAGAVDITLEDIANSFNSCQTVDSYKDYNMDISAKVDGNKISVGYKAGEVDTRTEYILEDNILSAFIPEKDALAGLSTLMILVDSIGQLHGYDDGDMFYTLNGPEIQDYTIENEGFEMKEIEDEGYQIKIDINKKIPLTDFSDYYIKMDDLEDFELDILSSSDGGSISGKKGPIRYNISKYGAIEISIDEEDGLTNRAYNTLLTFLEAIYGKDKVEYFKENYESVEVGNKSFDDFNIELSEEEQVEKGVRYGTLKVTIGSSEYEEEYEEIYEDDVIDEKNDLIKKEVIICFTVICVVGIGGLCLMILEKRKDKRE